MAPMDFMRLPFAAIFGWLLFRESSDLWTWAGAAIARDEYTQEDNAVRATKRVQRSLSKWEPARVSSFARKRRHNVHR